MSDQGGCAVDYARDIQAIAARRDSQAFRRLFDYFGPRLKTYLMSAGAESTQAEDLMQDAMVALWHKAHLFDPTKARASTWLFTIARNLRIDALRRQSRQSQQITDHTDPTTQPAEIIQSDHLLAQKQDRTRIKQALSDLTPDQRDVIRLCFFQDLSHSQIAQALNLPLGTVKSRIRLAVAKLRTTLEHA